MSTQLELSIDELSDFNLTVWNLEPVSGGFDVCELPQFLRAVS